LVVIDEFLTVSLYQPNEFISRNHLMVARSYGFAPLGEYD